MGLLNLFSKSAAPNLTRLPSGSFTMDRSGRVVISTLPSNFEVGLLEDLGHTVLATFKEARETNLPLEELNVQFGSLKVSARDLAGGAIVFFTPFTPISANTNNKATT